MNAFPGRAEGPEQVPKLFMNVVLVACEAWLAANQASEGEQQEERLVRGPLVPAAMLPQAGDAPEELFPRHRKKRKTLNRPFRSVQWSARRQASLASSSTSSFVYL